MKRRAALISALILGSVVFSFPDALAAQVTSGLLIDINVENPNSYTGSGTTLNDVMGSNNLGTLMNSPTYIQGIESGIRFDGVNDYMQISNTSELQFTVSNTFTYMFWGKIESYSSFNSIVSKQFDGSPGGYDGFCLCLDTGNKLILAENGNALNDGYVTSANAFTLNTWTLFTAVVRFGGGSSNPNKIYVNGNEVLSQGNLETGIANNTPSITVAAGYNGNSKFAGITMGALAIYNRALSAAEVQTSYDYYSNYFNDVSSISLASSANVKKGVTATITATVGARGKVRFFSNGKRIAGCLNVPVQFASLPLTATCTWKPTTSGLLNLSARLYPSSGGVSEAVSSVSVQTGRRSTVRQ
jgi:hypothetical protein